MIAVVMGQSVLGADKKPLIADPIVEKAIRKQLNKPTGELTKADLEEVTHLFFGNKLTDVADLNNLTQLTRLDLVGNRDALPKGLENLTELTQLWLHGNQLTDVTGLEKLTQLKTLGLYNNPDLTKARIAELKNALPKCFIFSDPTK